VPYFDKVVQGMTRPYMLGDQRFAERRPDVLAYASEPLETDLILAGPVEAVLRISSTGTDSDFIVKVIDVYPDDLPDGSPEVKLGGYEQLVRGEPFRAKFRNSFEKPEPLVPNRTDTIRFSMPDIDHCFRRGHRVMVQVQSSWFPLVDRNPQIFTNIPTAARGDYKKATERVYHSSSDPSFIEVRVVGPVPVVH
jgi:hypothetical protein